MRRPRGPRRLVPLVALAGGLALSGAAAALSVEVSPAGLGRADVAITTGLRVGEMPAASRPAGAAKAVRLDRLRIPRLEIDARVNPERVNRKGTLGIPEDPSVLGWWADGARPGADRGTAIIAGHVNSSDHGPGALAELYRLRPGDTIIVIGAGKRIRYRVEALRQYTKHRLPASKLFSQEVEGRIAIVSCGGPFDPTNGHYRDNIVAIAVPA